MGKAEPEIHLRIDRPRLVQLILVLVDNAIDHSPSGGEVSVRVRHVSPAVVIEVETLPMTVNGKLDVKALPTADSVLGERSGESIAPRNHTEEVLCDLFSDVLDVGDIGVDDNFFELGGHSLLAVKIFRRLSVATGASLALTDIFRYPTVRSFAARLDALQAAEKAQAAQGAPTLAPASQRGLMRRQALAHRKGDPVG